MAGSPELTDELLAEQALSAEEQVERRIDALIRDLDEMCAMASNPETVDLIQNERHSLGLAKTRIDLILSFLIARQPAKLKMVQNNG